MDSFDAKLRQERDRLVALLTGIGHALAALPVERLAEILPIVAALDAIVRRLRQRGILVSIPEPDVGPPPVDPPIPEPLIGGAVPGAGEQPLRFVAVVRQHAASDYRVDFPDLPGCTTAGKTMEEARRMAAEALSVHLEHMVAEGLAVPVPRDLRTIRDDPACAGGTTLILVETRDKLT
jgi:predicted RNase H-like HicB family nuclease